MLHLSLLDREGSNLSRRVVFSVPMFPSMVTTGSFMLLSASVTERDNLNKMSVHCDCAFEFLAGIT